MSKNYKKNTNKSKKNKSKKIFSKKHYNSGDGMLTSVWGPSMWHSLHTISFNYPVNPTTEDKKNYKDFIMSLRYVLPCKYCRINLTENLKKFPITCENMKNRESFSRYIYELHETVNKMRNKKSGLTYSDVRERYEHFRARCADDKPTVFTFENLNTKEKENKNKTMKKREKGCTEPLYGKKSKCIIKIVPQDDRYTSFTKGK